MPSTLTVTNTADIGPGSLPYEITQAQSGDTIVFNFGTSTTSTKKHEAPPPASTPTPQTIYVTSELDINKNLTIQGPGAGLLTISGYSPNSSTYVSRIFEVDGATVTLSGMTISNGGGHGGSYDSSPDGLDHNKYGYDGGAILNLGGTLTISACTLSNNSALDPSTDLVWWPSNTYGNGGAIYNTGVLNVSGCTLSNNSAGECGGGIYNAGTATVNGCTFTGNSAPDGGGIYNYQTNSLTVLYSSFSGNYSSANPYGQNISGAYTDGGGNTFH